MAEAGNDRDTFGMVGAGLAVLGLVLALITLLLTASGAVGTWSFGLAVLGLLAGAVALVLAAMSITSKRRLDPLLALVCIAALVAFGVFGYTFVGLSNAAAAQLGRTAADTVISVQRPGSPTDDANLPLTGDEDPADQPALPDTGEKVVLAETGGRRSALELGTGSRTAPFPPGTELRLGGWEITVGSPGNARSFPVTLTRTSSEPGPANDISVAVIGEGGQSVSRQWGPAEVVPSGQTAVVDVAVVDSAGGLISLEIGGGAPVYFDALN